MRKILASAPRLMAVRLLYLDGLRTVKAHQLGADTGRDIVATLDCSAFR